MYKMGLILVIFVLGPGLGRMQHNKVLTTMVGRKFLALSFLFFPRRVLLARVEYMG